MSSSCHNHSKLALNQTLKLCYRFRFELGTLFGQFQILGGILWKEWEWKISSVQHSIVMMLRMHRSESMWNRPFISVPSSNRRDQKTSPLVTPFIWFLSYTYSVSTGNFYVFLMWKTGPTQVVGFMAFLHMRFQRCTCHCVCNIAATDGLLQIIGMSDSCCIYILKYLASYDGSHSPLVKALLYGLT